MRLSSFAEGVYAAPIEILVTHFHLRLSEIRELTPLQRGFYLEMYSHHVGRMKEASRRNR
jgi:hypothetical protein